MQIYLGKSQFSALKAYAKGTVTAIPETMSGGQEMSSSAL